MSKAIIVTNDKNETVVFESDDPEKAKDELAYLKVQCPYIEFKINTINKPVALYNIKFKINEKDKTFKCLMESVTCFIINKKLNDKNKQIKLNRYEYSFIATVIQDINNVNKMEAIMSAAEKIVETTDYMYDGIVGNELKAQEKYVLNVLKDIHNKNPMIISEHDTYEDAKKYEEFLRAQKFQSPIEISLVKKPLIVYQIDFMIDKKERTFKCWKEMVKCYSAQKSNGMSDLSISTVTENRMHATVVQNIDSISLEEAINTASKEINRITGYTYVDKGDQKNVCFR